MVISKFNPKMRHFIGAAIGAAGSLAGNVIGAISQNKNIDKQIAATRKENEESRKFNRESAQIANQWSIDQWNRENAYNTPQAIMQRLKQGNLNADLMYGQGAGNLPAAASSPTVAQTAPASPADVSALGRKQTLGDVWNQTLQSTLTAAQVEKTKQESENTGQQTQNLKVEGQILSADALTRAAQNEQALEIGKSQIYVNHSVAKLNHSEQEKISAQITELAAQTNKLYSDVEVNKAKIKNLNADTAQARYGLYMRSKEFKLKVQEFMQMVKESNSRINLNYQQAADILATQSGRVLGINVTNTLNSSKISTEYENRKRIRSQTSTSDALGNLFNIQADQASFNLDSDKGFKNVERGVQVAKNVTSIITDIANAASNFVSGTGFGKLQNPSNPRVGRSWH